MRFYMVGGAVRDKIMGIEPTDKDWVVVGASPQDMLEKGFIPVGKDFPVFLHPQTKEEYALARTERKNGSGYKGFTVYSSPQTTLEEDLKRRDLTINAIAMDSFGQLIDPFGGVRDLENKILRHVSDAFVEDPLRVLRLGRFHARYPNFSIFKETIEICHQIVSSGELSFLARERIGQEIKKGLCYSAPEKMFSFFLLINCFKIIFPPTSHLSLPEIKKITTSSYFPTHFSSEQKFSNYFGEILSCDHLVDLSQYLRYSKNFSRFVCLWSKVRSYKSLPIDSVSGALAFFDNVDLWRQQGSLSSILEMMVHLKIVSNYQALDLREIFDQALQVKLVEDDIKDVTPKDIKAILRRKQLDSLKNYIVSK